MREMQMILLDMQLSETYSLGLGYDTLNQANKFKKNYDSLHVFYASVLNRHKMSFEEFIEAMNWYEKRPLMMDSLIGNTIEQLNKQKASLNIKDYENPKSKDPENKMQRKALLMNLDSTQVDLDSAHQVNPVILPHPPKEIPKEK